MGPACSVRSSGSTAGRWPRSVGKPPRMASSTCWAGPTGEAAGVRDAWRHDLVPHLGSLEAVRVVDETGFPKKGRHSAGVARQDNGTLGKIAKCQVGVLLGDASPRGQTVLDRARYVPQEWPTVRERCWKAGIPAARRVATKPQRAQQMLARAFAAGVPARGVTGDRVYGADRWRRMWLEARPQADVLAVSGQA
jgi:SRSO17 transposase